MCVYMCVFACMCKQYLALDNVKGLVCQKTKPTINHQPNIFYSSAQFVFHLLVVNFSLFKAFYFGFFHLNPLMSFVVYEFVFLF